MSVTEPLDLDAIRALAKDRTGYFRGTALALCDELESARTRIQELERERLVLAEAYESIRKGREGSGE